MYHLRDWWCPLCLATSVHYVVKPDTSGGTRRGILRGPVRPGHRQVRHRVGELVIDTQLEMDVRPGRVPSRPLEPDHLASHRMNANLGARLEQVSGNLGASAAVRDDPADAVTDLG